MTPLGDEWWLRYCFLLILFKLEDKRLDPQPRTPSECLCYQNLTMNTGQHHKYSIIRLCPSAFLSFVWSVQPRSFGVGGRRWMGSCVFWGVTWPWVDLCSYEDCFCASKMEMIVISCSDLSPWPWNNHRCFNLLKNCLYDSSHWCLSW